ncbi:DNA-binding transcriptional regulator, XRE-family HTH domain [Mucilaginibacter gossypiicola]|uniref:DNA-binding transcriptional regulator, XRE-family HTH domain n=2 Tax=Mucilaginibacter gossypiicola TaxID=551995 RepID=A0A1H8A5P5_9SPHI|nr:DNA-binding transcriptional regulator, XRE-family HTH domain [Mucilaginibacter gossypiicola]
MYNHFHKNLKRLRKRHGLTQQAFAEKFKGIDRNNISAWENEAEPAYFRLIQIAEFFGLTTDQILKEEIL